MVLTLLLPVAPWSSPTPQLTRSVQTVSGSWASTQVQGWEEKEQTLVDVAPATEASAVTDGANWWQIVYAVGLGLSVLLLLVRIVSLLTLHLRSRPVGQYRLLPASAGPGQAFTFGHAIYCSDDLPASPDFEYILAHERIHARELHSLDLLLGEVFLCLFWFHPVAWWLHRQQRANLEYLVDRAVVQGGADRKAYQLALVRQSQQTGHFTFGLPFSEPSLRSRITRLTGIPKYRAVAILAAGLLVIWAGIALSVINGSTEKASRPAGVVEVDLDMSLSELYPQPVSPDTTFTGTIRIYIKKVPTPAEMKFIREITEELTDYELRLYQSFTDGPDEYTLALYRPYELLRGYTQWSPTDKDPPRMIEIVHTYNGSTGVNYGQVAWPAHIDREATVAVVVNGKATWMYGPPEREYSAESLDDPIPHESLRRKMYASSDARPYDLFDGEWAYLHLDAGPQKLEYLEGTLEEKGLQHRERIYYINETTVTEDEFAAFAGDADDYVQMGTFTELPGAAVYLQLMTP